MKTNRYNLAEKGATALIAAIFTAAVMLSVTISLAIISINMNSGYSSFADSIRAFYAAEAGVGEALMQLRKQPDNFIFSTTTFNGIEVSSEFIDTECEVGLPCYTVIETTAMTLKATRKVRYSCDQDITDCLWEELTP